MGLLPMLGHSRTLGTGPNSPVRLKEVLSIRRTRKVLAEVLSQVQNTHLLTQVF